MASGGNYPNNRGSRPGRALLQDLANTHEPVGPTTQGNVQRENQSGTVANWTDFTFTSFGPPSGSYPLTASQTLSNQISTPESPGPCSDFWSQGQLVRTGQGCAQF